MSDLFDTIKGIFSGETPIERQERKPGESKYYLIKPGQEGKRFSELETTDIPDEEEESAWNKVKNAANNFAGGTEAFSVGYATGASLGNFDEGIGAATAAATGNQNNYAKGRDATRKLQNNLQQQHPIAYGVGEFVGAMTTPMHLAKDTTFANKAFNATTDTLNASAGYAENWKDFGTNLAVNSFTNGIGLGIGFTPLGRGAGATGKKIIKQGFNFLTDKAKNMFYDDEDEY